MKNSTSNYNGNHRLTCKKKQTFLVILSIDQIKKKYSKSLKLFLFKQIVMYLTKKLKQPKKLYCNTGSPRYLDFCYLQFPLFTDQETRTNHE